MKDFKSFYLLTESYAEKEVERFLKAMLPGTPFAGITKAVGGYVRDEYLSLVKNDPSIESKDLDIVIGMKDGAEKLTKYIYDILGSKISTPRNLGAGYPIWKITFKDDIEYKGQEYNTAGAEIDFADAMKEEFPDPTSRQRVTSSSTIEDDIERRDFTVNMLLKDMTTGEIEDLTGQSKEDIKNGILRGHPKVSFDMILTNDPLRMIRLVRFQAKYGWKVPMAVLKTIKRNAERIKIVSPERIIEELAKLMNMGKLYSAIRLMSTTGLLKYILPEIEELKGVPQSPKHHGEGDAYVHTLMVLKNAKPGVVPQLAALLHDVGKASTTTKDEEGKITSHGHDEVGAKIAEEIMKRMKVSVIDSSAPEKVKKIISLHMRPHFLGRPMGGGVASSKSIRSFVREAGDVLEDVLDLARADETGKIPPTDDVPRLRERIAEIGATVEKKKPILDGREIMDLLGIKRGIDVGKAVKIVADLEDEYGSELTKEFAKEELKKRFVTESVIQANRLLD